MEGGNLRDINELLVNGYFRTARGKSPSQAPISTPAPASDPISINTAFLSPATQRREPQRERSRSRGRPRGPPPPKPSVEDEASSLAKEYQGSTPSYDPPLRGILDQNPIILEADISEAEAARLHELTPTSPDGKGDRNSERRFVFVPRSDTSSSNSSEDSNRRKAERKRDSGKSFQTDPSSRERDGNRQPPPLDRRRSPADLPTLETKVPREIPPQFKRSNSAYAYTPVQETPKTTRTPSEYFLSPEAIRGGREAFTPSQSAPRYHTQETFGGRAAQGAQRNSQNFSAYSETSATEKRNSGSFQPGRRSRTNSVERLPEKSSRPRVYPDHSETSTTDKRSSSYQSGRRSRTNSIERLTEKLAKSGIYAGRVETPVSEKRNSGNVDSGRRSRRNSIEKSARPLFVDDLRRSEKEKESRRSSRSSNYSNRHYYSSTDDELVDSDSDRPRRRRKHHGHKLHPGDHHHRSSSNSGLVPRPRNNGSRLSSPLVSPQISPSQLPAADQVERSGSFPIYRRSGGSRGGSRETSPHGPRDAKLNPFEGPAAPLPVSRHSSGPIPMPMPMRPTESMPSLPLPIPIPSRNHIHASDDRRSPAPVYDDRSVTAKPQEPSTWQLPKFQPPTNLEKPVGSYRRYSEDIERGSVAPLPTCPRKTYVRGKNDWLTLPQCPGFDICPSCYNSTMAPTEFRHMFVPSPPRPVDTEVICDFGSSPWYRIAWLLTRKERRRDLNFFYGVAKVAETVQPCLGNREAHRQWLSIIDPKTGKPIRNFDVCYSCVRAIEVLLPALKGIFIRTDAHTASSVPRICDLRFDSKRFVHYFDALETTADQADYDLTSPDTRNLAALARRYALIEECQKDTDLRDARWHIITQLPEFSVCPECFSEIVWPELEKGKPIPMMFNKNVQKLPRGSCQLYSERMRRVFKTAVKGDDYKFLAAKVRERRTIEAAYKSNLADLKRIGGPSGSGGPGMGSVNSVASSRVNGEIERVRDEWRKWE